MTATKYFFLFCTLICAFFLSGCGGEDSRQNKLQLYITQLKLAAANKQQSNSTGLLQLPDPVKYQPDSYSGSINRDVKATTNPLQSYPIKALQFVGTLTQDNLISAYIMAPDGVMYLAKVGDVIGDTYGKIVKIDSDHIEISEKYNMTGNQTGERIVTMELKD